MNEFWVPNMQRSTQTSFTPILQAATILSIVAAIVVNALSNIFPPNGLSIGAIANTILAPVLITPANYAFSIWGLIYIGLIAFGIYQATPAQRSNNRLQKLRAPIIWSSVFQIIWVYLFQFQQFWLSVVAIVGILVNLIAAFVWAQRERFTSREKWLVQYPISIYLGWISVATIVNVASALFASGWNGWSISPVVWTVMMLLIAAAITVVIAIQFRDGAFPLVIVWALMAIAVRQASQPALVTTALGLAIAIAVLILLTQFRFGQKLR